MRIALLADVHANLEALTACLEHADRAGASRCVFLGDLVGYGADPGPVLGLVRALLARGGAAVLGNHDQGVILGPAPGMNPEAKAVIEWTRARLSPDELAFLSALPLSAEEGPRLYVHANAYSDFFEDPTTWLVFGLIGLAATRRRSAMMEP